MAVPFRSPTSNAWVVQFRCVLAVLISALWYLVVVWICILVEWKFPFLEKEKFKLFFFKKKLCLFLRQRETEHERGRVRERGRHRIWNRLQTLSCQHRARRGARTHGPWDRDLSRSRPLNRLSHPGSFSHFFSYPLSNLFLCAFIHLLVMWVPPPQDFLPFCHLS